MALVRVISIGGTCGRMASLALSYMVGLERENWVGDARDKHREGNKDRVAPDFFSVYDSGEEGEAAREDIPYTKAYYPERAMAEWALERIELLSSQYGKDVGYVVLRRHRLGPDDVIRLRVTIEEIGTRRNTLVERA